MYIFVIKNDLSPRLKNLLLVLWDYLLAKLLQSPKLRVTMRLLLPHSPSECLLQTIDLIILHLVLQLKVLFGWFYSLCWNKGIAFSDQVLKPIIGG